MSEENKINFVEMIGEETAKELGLDEIDTPDAFVEKIKTYQSPDFESLIGDELAQDPTIAKFKDAKSLAKSYLEIQKMVGKKQQTPPAVVEKEDDLQFEPWQLPDGYQPNEDYIKSFKQMVVDSKSFTPQQAELIYKWLGSEEEKNIQNMNANKHMEWDKKEAALKTEWATAYQENTNLARRVAETVVPDELKDMMFKAGWIDYPPIKKMFYELGKNSLKEDVIEKNAIVGGGMTRNQLIAKQKELAAELLKQNRGTSLGRQAIRGIEKQLRTIAELLNK